MKSTSKQLTVTGGEGISAAAGLPRACRFVEVPQGSITVDDHGHGCIVILVYDHEAITVAKHAHHSAGRIAFGGGDPLDLTEGREGCGQPIYFVPCVIYRHRSMRLCRDFPVGQWCFQSCVQGLDIGIDGLDDLVFLAAGAVREDDAVVIRPGLCVSGAGCPIGEIG